MSAVPDPIGSLMAAAVAFSAASVAAGLVDFTPAASVYCQQHIGG